MSSQPARPWELSRATPQGHLPTEEGPVQSTQDTEALQVEPGRLGTPSRPR